MKTLIKLEDLGVFLFSIYLFSLLPFPWWFYPLFFFVPDISMVGYIAGPGFGAFTYNLIHHKAIALGLFVVGSVFNLPIMALIGVILLGHTSLDRVFSYGLKFSDSFNHTQLGVIGRNK